MKTGKTEAYRRRESLCMSQVWSELYGEWRAKFKQGHGMRVGIIWGELWHYESQRSIRTFKSWLLMLSAPQLRGSPCSQRALDDNQRIEAPTIDTRRI